MICSDKTIQKPTERAFSVFTYFVSITFSFDFAVLSILQHLDNDLRIAGVVDELFQCRIAYVCVVCVRNERKSVPLFDLFNVV